jgi:hypothetical protein
MQETYCFVIEPMMARTTNRKITKITIVPTDSIIAPFLDGRRSPRSGAKRRRSTPDTTDTATIAIAMGTHSLTGNHPTY